MDIGVPHEQPEQAPIAATPQSVEKLVSLGYTVRVERGAGTVAHIPDDDYREAGADLVDAEAAWGCEVVLAAHTPSSRSWASCAAARCSSAGWTRPVAPGCWRT